GCKMSNNDLKSQVLQRINNRLIDICNEYHEWDDMVECEGVDFEDIEAVCEEVLPTLQHKLSELQQENDPQYDQKIDQFVDLIQDWEQSDCIGFIQELLQRNLIPLEIIERQK